MSERLGDYALEKLVGRGGMAEVYRAVGVRGANKGRTVAIKKLLPSLARDPAYVDAFVGEADVSRSLRHPGIVSVLATGLEGDTYFMVMDFIEGRDLAQIIKQAGRQKEKMPIDLCCYITHVVALALDYAHRLRSKQGEPLGLVHCDVSPSNIFVANDGVVRLGDFGVAHSRLMTSALADKGIAGKASYLAPEQIEEERLSPATDVFGLGAVLFEMLTGRKAFDGKTPADILRRITAGDVPASSSLREEVPARLDAIVARCLAVTRQSKEKLSLTKRVLKALPGQRPERYATAAHLAIDLERVYDHATVAEAALAAWVARLFGA